MNEWIKEFAGAVTICSKEGIILEMNDASVKVFEEDGGKSLIGKNLIDCHPEPSRSKLKEMLENEITNTYTIEKNGKKKMIHQFPWYKDGEYKGFVELSFEIPMDMPHFIRS